MSTDQPGAAARVRAAAAERRTERRSRAFRRTVALTLVVLGVAAGAAGIVGAIQGPKLRSAAVDPVVATERADQRVVLRFDQPVQDVEVTDIAIDPAVPLEVSTDQTSVTIRLGSVLDHGTEYVITADVVGSATGRSGTAEYRFVTPGAEMATLVREADADDRVELRTLDGGDPTVLMEAPRIQEFALLPAATAAIVLGDDDSTTVALQAFGDPAAATIPLPDEGRAADLRSSGRTGIFGFTVTGQTIGDDGELELLSTLMIYDPVDGSGIPRTVEGLDGEPVQVQEWMFVPDTSSLVAQTFDAGLLLIDTTGLTAPVPLGEFTDLRGFLPGTTTLVVADPTAVSAIDLASGETRTLDLPEVEVPEGTYETGFVIAGEESYVEIVSRAVSEENPFDLRFAAIVVDEQGTGLLYDATESAAVIREICVSPNGQYAAVAVSDDGAEFDAYPDEAAYFGMTSIIVSIADGEIAGSARGTHSDWCVVD